MKKNLIYLCLIIILFLIFFSYKTFENFNNKKYIQHYVGPIIFYDYNDNKMGTYPDENIWPLTFEKKDGKYINLIGAGDPFEIKFPKSNKGDIGPKGYKGLQGDIGIKGKKGENITGPKGPKGNKGDKGDRGETGSCESDNCSRGSKGDKGNKGPRGNKGAKGFTGDRPLKNEAEKGIRGEKGVRGIKGTKGDKGAQGPKGPIGSIGLPGRATAKKGYDGIVIPRVVTEDGNYLLINREEDINSPKEIKIGNNLTNIDISSKNVYLKNLCINKSGYKELCINKEDIRRLNEFNNAECICPNGEVNKDECADNGIISCKSCGNNYYLKNIISNTKLKKNISTNICESCASAPSCPDGQYFSGCGGGTMGRCVQCPGCPLGQHRINCNKTSIGTCVNNVCQCENGIAATGEECTNHNDKKCTSCGLDYYKNGNTCDSCASAPSCPNGQYLSGCGGGTMGTCVQCPTCPSGQHRKNCNKRSIGRCVKNVCRCTNGIAAARGKCRNHNEEKCTSCDSGYYKNGNRCVQCTQCGAGKHETRSCDTLHNRECAWNKCTCTRGTAAEGTRCTTNGKEQCISCSHEHYSLSNGRCVQNTIQFFTDIWYRGDSARKVGDNGTKTSLKYGYPHLNNKIASFKKDPDAKITLYDNEDGTGNCLDLTGIGDTDYLYNWDGKIGAIGYGGTPCNDNDHWPIRKPIY